MELWTSFLLGLVGSLHCAGMCGPLALALPMAGRTRSDFVLGRLLYNAGRVVTYCVIGAIFGLAGQGLALAGLQRWLSLVTGSVILLGLVCSARPDLTLGQPFSRGVIWLKSRLLPLLQKRTFGSLFLLGTLNGLLPCGLVYVAAAAAAATGSFYSGILSMSLFGLGTLPVMLGIGLAGKKLHGMLNIRFPKLIPVTLAVLGVLLLLRGLELGIPYVSPVLAASGSCPHCH